MFPVERLPGQRNISGSLASILRRPSHPSSYFWKQFIRKIDHLLSKVSMKQFARKAVLTSNFGSRLRTDLLSMSMVWPTLLGESGEVDRYIGTTVDITERKRGEALFAGEKRLLEMIATGVALKEILNALCLIIEEYRPGTLASILLLRSDGLHLDSVAGPSLPKGWRQEMEKLPIGPCAGSCGTAAYRGSAGHSFRYCD